eukprot:6559112-Prymnesium_polylepis.1
MVLCVLPPTARSVVLSVPQRARAHPGLPRHTNGTGSPNAVQHPATVSACRISKPAPHARPRPVTSLAPLSPPRASAPLRAAGYAHQAGMMLASRGRRCGGCRVMIAAPRGRAF